MARQNVSERLEALEKMAPAQLHDQWLSVTGEPPPNVATKLLRRLLAQHIQEKRYGGLPAAIERRLLVLARGEEVALPSVAAVSDGTRLVREWQGRTIEVVAIDGGFQWDGQRYGSLSKIARVVTGTHQSGPRFFGLNGHHAHG
jgi:hypothetical protein